MVCIKADLVSDLIIGFDSNNEQEAWWGGGGLILKQLI